MKIGSLRRDAQRYRVAHLFARLRAKVKDVVVNHDGGHRDAGAAFVLTVGHQAGVNVNVAFDSANAFGGNLHGEILDNGEWVAGQRGAIVRVIVVHEGERAVGLNAIRKIGVAAGNEDEVAFQRAMFVDRPGAIDVGVKAIVGTKFRKDRTFGK